MELYSAEIKKYLKILTRRKYLFIFLALSVMSVIIWGSYLLPRKYKAESMVFIEQSIIRELVEGIAINPSISQKIRVLRYAMLSRTNVLDVLRDLDRDTAAEDKKQLEAMIEDFQKRTQINIRGNDLFTVSILDTDPVLARDYINTLVRMYVEEVISAKREDSYGANRFLNEQVEFFKNNLEQAEDAILKFRQKQGIYVATNERSIIEEIKTYQQDLNKVKITQKELANVLTVLKTQLQMVEPYTVATYTHQKRVASESVAEAYENRISALLTRYTENHPEVIKMRAELEAVTSGPAEEVLVAENTDEVEPETSAVNPVYQKLEQEIFETEAGIQALETRGEQLAEALAAKKRELNHIPETRKALAALERARDSQKDLYNKLLARQGQSWVSKKMEIEDKSATFKIVDPAVLPQTFATPNMQKMILVGIFLGIMGGLGGVLLREQFDSSIRAPGTVKKLGLPLIGIIPMVFDEAEVNKEKRKARWVYALAGLYFCVIGSTLIVEMMGLKFVESFFQNLPVESIAETAGQLKSYVRR
ncbi:XrtA system polysaccharide chain length determinant [Candidatus Moduliflexota bacterium]